jgi:hypothetical protein
MPGVYKKKNCANPKCGIEHRRRGPYCSQGCHNSHREVTEQTKKNISKGLREYNQTPEGIAAAKRVGQRLSMVNSGQEHNMVNQEDFAVDIPNLTTLDDFEDFLDGFDKGESW